MAKAALALAIWTIGVAAACAEPETFAGPCVTVIDGDTIDVLRGDQKIRVRLEGIDAPERGEPYNAKARTYLAALVHRETVEVRVKELDRYGRTVGRVIVGGRDTSLALVQSGLARHYTRYSDDPELAAAERRARSAHLNLWSPTDTHGGAPKANASGAPRSPPEQAKGLVYHGNRKSRVFHAPGCPHYDCENCTAVFSSREEALSAGYRPAGDCGP